MTGIVSGVASAAAQVATGAIRRIAGATQEPAEDEPGERPEIDPTVAPALAVRGVQTNYDMKAVLMTARCPRCGVDAVWHGERKQGDCTEWVRIVCTCATEESEGSAA